MQEPENLEKFIFARPRGRNFGITDRCAWQRRRARGGGGARLGARSRGRELEVPPAARPHAVVCFHNDAPLRARPCCGDTGCRPGRSVQDLQLFGDRRETDIQKIEDPDRQRIVHALC